MLIAKVWTTHISGHIGLTDHLTSVVHALRASQSSPKRWDVQHGAVLPQKRMLGRDPGRIVRSRVCVRGSGYQAVTFVCAAVAGTGIWPTQGAQIVHHSVFPYERVL